MENKNIIGLFGTCGNNRWRDDFMARYNQLGIQFFNPMVEEWNSSMAAIEADHMATDRIIIMSILGWSYGVASLAEAGICAANASLNPNRHFIFFIEKDMDARLDDPDRCKDSKNARILVLKHLRRLGQPIGQLHNIHVVNSLEEALELSIKLY